VRLNISHSSRQPVLVQWAVALVCVMGCASARLSAQETLPTDEVEQLESTPALSDQQSVPVRSLMPPDVRAVQDATTEDVEPAIPTDEQLERLGARIGVIEIQVDNVFDPDNPKEHGVVYRAANALHIKTREATVRPQLLFRSGEVYSMHAMDETARNLRERRYLADATITPIRYYPGANTVDVLVRVRDVWTLTPGTTYGRSGGASHSGFQLEEQNLLGLGKAVQVQRTKTVDRSSWDFSYRDPNLLSTRWDMKVTYSSASDGGSKSLDVTHPFFSLDTRYSGSLNMASTRQLTRVFEQGVQVDQYLTQQRAGYIQGGWSTGLRGTGTQWVLRSTLGYQVDDRHYAPDPVSGTLTLPVDTHTRYPWLGLSWLQDKYVVTRNRERIELTEDMYVGRSAGLTLGYSSKTFDADKDALILGVMLQDAYVLSYSQNLFVNWSMNGRREQGQWRGTTYSTSVRYDWREGARYLVAVKFNHAYVQELDESQQLYLGSDEGLRGYPLRYRSGSERMVLNVEQRVYSNVQILRLLSVGAAAYVDVGRIGGEAGATAGSQRTFADVGIGLRLGNIRSSGGEMFHFDLAYPFNAPSADRKVQFSIVTKTTF
jgi:outer membrane protein assembly factor BamA